ncbi:hypothetical protein GR254_06120 [Mycobacterium tuberculosis]|nr:hypothetical protein [Mycobacterium tuberculosis]
MTGDQNPAPGPAPGVPIKVTPEILLQVLTTPPASGPAPFPAVPVDLPAPADIANGALFAAGNSGVPGDVESSGLEDLDRRAHAADAVQKFSANEADAAQQFQGVGAQAEAQGATQMMQQAVSGITGALGGAVGGVMGPLTQLPQQAMQAGQGAMQPLMSALQQTYGAEGLDVADGARLVDSIEGEPGEILVAEVTDVGYTAAFCYAAAVVTELGGPMSHAAVVAREFGFPCVVDAQGATRFLPPGALVEVDGATGEIHVVELASEDGPALPGSDLSR